MFGFSTRPSLSCVQCLRPARQFSSGTEQHNIAFEIQGCRDVRTAAVPVPNGWERLACDLHGSASGFQYDRVVLPVRVQNSRVCIGDRFSVSFQRTPRVDSGVLNILPRSRGQLPVRLVDDEILVPCDSDEAVWLGFAGETSEPVALRIRVGSTDAVTARNGTMHLT
jgi:hypothetical protein